MPTSRYAIAGPNIVSETFDGDIVVLDLESGRYFSFTDAGRALWQGLAEGIAPAALVAGAAFSQEEVQGFLRQLLDARLLVETAEPARDTVPSVLLEQLARAREKPDITVFDDLADLFLADPIHDVEVEAGWPVRERG